MTALSEFKSVQRKGIKMSRSVKKKCMLSSVVYALICTYFDIRTMGFNTVLSLALSLSLSLSLAFYVGETVIQNGHIDARSVTSAM
jgi:hypothetical protein